MSRTKYEFPFTIRSRSQLIKNASNRGSAHGIGRLALGKGHRPVQIQVGKQTRDRTRCRTSRIAMDRRRQIREAIDDRRASPLSNAI